MKEHMNSAFVCGKYQKVQIRKEKQEVQPVSLHRRNQK